MTTAIDAQNINTDENVLKANGIKLKTGRDFMLNDTNRVFINETLAKPFMFVYRNDPSQFNLLVVSVKQQKLQIAIGCYPNNLE